MRRAVCIHSVSCLQGVSLLTQRLLLQHHDIIDLSHTAYHKMHCVLAAAVLRSEHSLLQLQSLQLQL
jgi:hypothetical protein